MRSFILITLILLFSSGITLAQEKKEEPFKNDPLFSSPIYKVTKKDKEDIGLTSDHDQDLQEPYYENLSEDGIDVPGFFNSGPNGASALYSVYPNLPMIHYNRVNVLFLGYKKDRMQWYNSDSWLGVPSVQLHGLIGYSTGQREMQYSLGLEKLIGIQNHIMIGGEYYNATTTDDDWRVGLNETTLTSFTAGYDYLDYYKQKGWGSYMLFRTDRFFEGGVAFSSSSYSSMNQQTSWALFSNRSNIFRPNPAIIHSPSAKESPVDITSVTVSASFNPRKLLLGPYFNLKIQTSAEFSDTGLGHSDFAYSKYTGGLKTNINFDPGTVFKYRLRFSSITGNAPRFKQLFLGGVGTLRALPYKTLGGGNQMILSNAELQFGRPIGTNSGWINVDDFYLSTFLDSGWVNYAQELNDSKNPLSQINNFSFADLQHNIGIGAGTSLLRGEVAWDLNHTSRAPVLWIRFNPTF